MATSDESVGNALKFAKLYTSNYRSWAFNMRLYLESQDLFEHADGTAESPGDEASANEVRSFRLKAKKVWTYICHAVEPDEQLHVRETTTATEAWDALKSQFARDSIPQKVRLRQKYYFCGFHSNGNMLEHINYLKSQHDQLQEMGIDVNDQELAMTLLASLPDEYMPLITALDAVGEQELSFEKVKGVLLNDCEPRFDKVEVKRHEDALSTKHTFNRRREKETEDALPICITINQRDRFQHNLSLVYVTIVKKEAILRETVQKRRALIYMEISQGMPILLT